ncbi:energy-coupling factor transporter transmembrane component T family protein [Adlercreutzia murintestinalis]|uniref:energy-coupling factor transporter transmembrane component T family protein n=1 Tax=Adlercreutzia murintestinalis TaxID=2941325 RepID=UPI00203B2830|nr:energy-coupling factor transporter transmembrane component T [Adlercreutzia murintestinalis]
MHHLDARSKIILLLVYSISIFFIDSWEGMFAAAALFVGALLLSRLPWGPVFKVALPVYVIAVFTVLANAFLFKYGSFAFRLEGLDRGFFFAVRILLLVWASLILCYTSTSTQLTDALASFMAPLRRWKVPVDDVAMVFSIALRFIPVTADEYLRIRDAQWSRGAPLSDGPILARLRAHTSILIPLFVGLFRRADTLAMAMDARCYGLPGIMRTRLVEHAFGGKEIAITVLGSACCIALAVLW